MANCDWSLIVHLIRTFVRFFVRSCTLEWIVWIEKGYSQKMYLVWEIASNFVQNLTLTVPRAQRQINISAMIILVAQEKSIIFLVFFLFLNLNSTESWAQQIKRNEWAWVFFVTPIFTSSSIIVQLFPAEISLLLYTWALYKGKFVPCFSSTVTCLLLFCTVTTTRLFILENSIFY